MLIETAGIVLISDIDAHEIAENLWQGAFPPPGASVRDAGFDTIVLCARELQMPTDAYPGVRIVYAPNDDSVQFPLTREKLRVAIQAAAEAKKDVQAGRRVLVTCAAGLNRSGLVSALILHQLFGWAGSECVRVVRAKRVGSKRHPGRALCNAEFTAAIRRLGARSEPQRFR